MAECRTTCVPGSRAFAGLAGARLADQFPRCGHALDLQFRGLEALNLYFFRALHTAGRTRLRSHTTSASSTPGRAAQSRCTALRLSRYSPGESQRGRSVACFYTRPRTLASYRPPSPPFPA